MRTLITKLTLRNSEIWFMVPRFGFHLDNNRSWGQYPGYDRSLGTLLGLLPYSFRDTNYLGNWEGVILETTLLCIYYYKLRC